MIWHVLSQKCNNRLGLAFAIVSNDLWPALLAGRDEELDGWHTLDRIRVIKVAACHHGAPLCVYGADVDHVLQICGNLFPLSSEELAETTSATFVSVPETQDHVLLTWARW